MRRLSQLIIIVLMFGIIAAGCAKKQVVSQSQQEEPMQQAASEPAMEKAAEPMEMEEVASPSDPMITSFKALNSGAHEVYFDFDKYFIHKDAKPVLNALADWMIKYNASIYVEGHCDERGTNQYNLALGDRRADAVKQYLIASGVSSSKISTVSYGEERPQCDEQNESCWKLNRRGYFLIP